MLERLVRALQLFGVLLLCILVLSPVLVVVGASLSGGSSTTIQFPPQSLSLKWYLTIPGEYWRALLFSMALALVVGVIATVLGGMVAFGIVRGRMPGRRALLTLVQSPVQVPQVVLGAVMLQFYIQLAPLLGVRLGGTFTGMLLPHVIFSLPFVTGTVIGVLERFDSRLEEAAAILGATDWRVFRRVTLPTIMPGLFGGGVYAFLLSFTNESVSLFLSGTKMVPLPVSIFLALSFDPSPAVLSISTIVILLSGVLVYFLQRLVGLDRLQGGGST